MCTIMERALRNRKQGQLNVSCEQTSLRTQPTFGDATPGFPAKWRLRNERRNSILMTRHYPDLGNASDWLTLCLKCVFLGYTYIHNSEITFVLMEWKGFFLFLLIQVRSVIFPSQSLNSWSKLLQHVPLRQREATSSITHLIRGSIFQTRNP